MTKEFKDKLLSEWKKSFDRETHWPEKRGHPKIKLEWSLRTLKETGFDKDLTDPAYKPFLFCEVPKNQVNCRMKWNYFKSKQKGLIGGYTGWIDFMQSWVCNTVCLISDDCKEFFLFYHFQNSDKHLNMLGKLCDDHYMTEQIKKSAKAYLRKVRK